MKCVYDFTANGFALRGYSPVDTSMSNDDKSDRVVVGAFIGETPDGKPFHQNATVSKDYIINNLKNAVEYQKNFMEKMPQPRNCLMIS